MIGSREMPTQEAIMRTWCKTLAEPHMVSINHIWSIFPGWQGPDCEFDMSRWLSSDDEFFFASQTHKHSQCEITGIFPRQWEYFMTVTAPPHHYIIQNQNMPKKPKKPKIPKTFLSKGRISLVFSPSLCWLASWPGFLVIQSCTKLPLHACKLRPDIVTGEGIHQPIRGLGWWQLTNQRPGLAAAPGQGRLCASWNCRIALSPGHIGCQWIK